MENLTPAMFAYFLVVAGVFGLVLGSFINCWAWRSMHGESVMKGRSHCTSCGHELGALDLVPVFSWLFSGRKCRYCGEPVSARYPATELALGCAFVAITARYGITVETAELLLFACVLLFLTLTDIDDYIIPSGCIIVALAVRAAYLVYCFATGAMDLGQIGFYVGSAFGVGIVMLIIVLVADKVFGRDAMGGGDLKLFFVAGFYFGWPQCVFLIFISCIIGLVFAFLAPGIKNEGASASESEDSAVEGAKAAKAGAKAADAAKAGNTTDSSSKNAGEHTPTDVPLHAFPFGPSIALACIITMFVGEPFISWYTGLLM